MCFGDIFYCLLFGFLNLLQCLLTMASDSSIDNVDQDSRRTCPSCSIRMSSLIPDKHSKCFTCRGVECSFENLCSECQSWPDDIMYKYIKHRKSFDSKSHKSKKSEKSGNDESRFHSSSGDSNVTPLGSVGSHSQGEDYLSLGLS